MKIELVKLVGNSGSSLDDGEKLFHLIYSELKKGASVELDFEDVQNIFIPFLNASFGRLLDHFEKETVMEKVILCNTRTDLLRRINEFVDRKEQMNSDAAAREMMQDLFEDDELTDSTL